MTRRKPKTKFGLDDRVRIVGPTVANFDTGHVHALPPGTVGTVADMWEGFGEYIVATDSGHGYDQWVFPESSLVAEDGAS